MNITYGHNSRPIDLDLLCHQVGPGWSKLVTELVTDLFAMGWDGHVLQCKEKFGGLRFYVRGADDQIQQRISAAEKDSYAICEQSGAPGELRHELNWIRVLCDDEFAKAMAIQKARF